VNTTRSTLARIGVGLFSLMLGTVLLLMLAGLYLADQTLRRASREQAAVDSRESALVLQRMIDAERAALTAFRGGFFSASAERPTTLAAIAATLASERPGLLRIWVTDSSGTAIIDTSVAAMGATGHTDPTALARRALSTGRPIVTNQRYGAGAHRLVVVVPLMIEGAPAGAAGGVFDLARLLAPITAAAQDRASIVVRRGDDTLLADITSLGPAERMTAGAPIPFGDTWTVDVAYQRSSDALRFAIWSLGLLGIVALGAGMIRERRQAVRISERSAELERLSAELLRANRMKSEFLANVSHELRTPLNAIVGFVELLRDGVYGDLGPRQVPPVERIAASATHLRHLVDQVLDIAKIAAGRLEVHSETIVLRPFVLNVASELESLVSERGLNLSLAVPASLPRVRTDPQHLRQILVNLIGNAIKYTPSGGISVRARLLGTPRQAGVERRPAPDEPTLLARAPDGNRVWVALQVIDTGIGIAPADQERIFEEFEQVNAGSRADSMERGTGLGLAISRRLSRLLGGDITVDSLHGKGSTFTLWLPVNAADLTAPVVPPPQPAEGVAAE